MAPSESEPKAPDKAAAGDKPCESTGEKPKATKGESAEHADVAGASKQVEDRNPGLSELDDIQLRKLLDEAITYKCPKDREGKSELFRELLQEAEADESEHAGSQRGGSVSSVSSGSGSRYRRGNTRKGNVSERNSRGGSLQNLVYALNSDLDAHAGPGFGRKRGGRRNLQPQVSVSARQREGGSLPCNVNADYTAAALLRSHDDIGTNASSSKRRDAHTPIDDVVKGNSYSYKLNSVKCNSGAVDDLSGYRLGSAKRAAGTVDDIVTATPRGSGNKRKGLKKLGHSSDDIYIGASVSDEARSVDEFRKEESRMRSEDIKNDNVEHNDTDSPELRTRIQNNVDGGRADHTVIDIDLRGRRNGPPMLGLGMNGTVRSGADRRWTKSESRKDDDIEGTEMVSMDRSADIIKYTAVRPSDHNGMMEEVDQPIDFFLNKSRNMSNGERLLQLNPSYRAVESIVGPQHDLSAGDSVRGTVESLGDAALAGDKTCASRLRETPYCVYSQWKAPSDKDLRFLRVDTPPRNLLQQLIGGAKESAEKKSYDENGNALHQIHSSNSERKFKARKVKTDNNPYVMSQAIPGHRGDEDINELLQFIESDSQDAKGTFGGKNTRNANGPVNINKDSKQRNSSSNGKRNEDGSQKLRSEKRKSSEKNNLQKSNSLEEISRTKLSDLTSADNGSTSKGVERRPKKQSTLDDEELVGTDIDLARKMRSSGGVGDRRSWGPEESTQPSEDEVSSRSRKRKGTDREQDGGRERGSGSGSGCRKKRDSASQVRSHVLPAESSELPGIFLPQSNDMVISDPAEFHVVTKKQRKKKSGRSSSIGRNERAQHQTQGNNYHSRDGQSRRIGGTDGSDTSVLHQYRSVSYRSDSPEQRQHQRRKSTSSMPPSDKSADSSDLDSVHSLPISSTSRGTMDKTPPSSGSAPQVSYADIARMASTMSPPQGQSFMQGLTQGNSPSVSQGTSPVTSPGLSLGSVQSQTKSSPPLWTANVTLHAATPLPPSQDEVDQSVIPPQSFSVSSNVAKRDATTNTVSPPESESTDTSPVGNLLSDNCYPPLRESGKSPLSVTQCVKTFITQASRTSPAVPHGVTMANCVDVEDSAKRAASPAFDSARESARTSAADRPAVIILDEAETEACDDGDPELTFGFEINEMLLSGACGPSSEEEEEQEEEEEEEQEQQRRSKATAPPPTKADPSFTAIPDINLDKIVAFVGRAWEDVMKELPCEAGGGGRVQYYSGQ